MKAELEALLLEWEERRDRGEAVSVEMLCISDPEDQAELRRQARLLEACDKLLGETCREEDTSPEIPSLPQVVGPYEVQGILGRGGMGVVYAGWDPILQRRVALKVLRPLTPWLPIGERDRQSRRFSQEAQVLAQLNHPHIVPVYAATVESSGCCIVMEQVRGGNLEQHRQSLAEAGPYAVAAFLEKVARAVHHAHSHGILHRDLKPANILLDEAGEPRVSDFGLAKLFAATEVDGGAAAPLAGAASPRPASPGDLTLPGQEPGTPPYMAPEQFDPNLGPIGPATDVWSLGVVLYELLTGIRPFHGKTRFELATFIRSENPTRPRKHKPRLPRRLETIVLRCLAKNPAERYPTAEALADALLRYREYPGRISRRLAGGLSALVLASAVFTPFFWRWGEANPPRSESVPERAYAEYQKQTTPLVTKLGRAEAVELVTLSDNKPAKVAYFPRDNAIKAIENTEGVHILGNGYAHFLELLPSVPLSHYRITAKIRLQSTFGEKCQWGVYFRYDQEQTNYGLQRYYQAVAFDRGKGLMELPGPGRKRSYYAEFMLHLYSDLLPPATKAFRGEHWFQSDAPSAVSRQVPAESVAQLWQTIAIDVSPEIVRASCLDSLGSFSLPPIPQKSNTEFQASLRDRYEDLAAIPWFPRPDASAVGIFLRASSCTVSGFRIEPMATNSSPR